jgi:hypothetical protein
MEIIYKLKISSNNSQSSFDDVKTYVKKSQENEDLIMDTIYTHIMGLYNSMATNFDYCDGCHYCCGSTDDKSQCNFHRKVPKSFNEWFDTRYGEQGKRLNDYFGTIKLSKITISHDHFISDEDLIFELDENNIKEFIENAHIEF